MEAEAEVFETFTTGAWLRDPGLEVAPALETELLSAWADQALAERPSDAGARTPDVTGSDRDEASADVEGQAEDESVASLERKLARAERRLHHLVRKDRRLERRTRAAVRHVQAYRRMAASAASRRSGSEGALWWSIRSMTRLAQARAAKKTGVRPGRDGSGFSWPAFGRISQGYGCTGFRLEPRVGGCAHFHDGIDIAAGYGTSVRASAPGVVAYVGWNPQDRGRRAFMVVIGHPGGFETVYGHLLAIRRVRVGQFVARGQSIGYVGNTGRSTGAHLHWEVSRGFSTLNPLAF
jgi:murein DD-endopeptidase MepM/ murein hydrolase activator NlpD